MRERSITIKTAREVFETSYTIFSLPRAQIERVIISENLSIASLIGSTACPIAIFASTPIPILRLLSWITETAAFKPLRVAYVIADFVKELFM